MIAEDQLKRLTFDWKVASWNRLFTEVLSSLNDDLTEKTVLEVGANKGGLSLFFSLRGCKVVCSDVRPDYVAVARRLHSAWIRRCAYLATDLRALPLRSGVVDLVVMKSVLGGVYASGGEEAVVAGLTEVHRVLRGGGSCLLLEQLEGDPLSRWLRSRVFPSRQWHYFSTDEFLEMNGGVSAMFRGGFRQVQWRCGTFLSHVLEEKLPPEAKLVRLACVVDRLIERFIPDNWKHLIGVVAVK